MPLRPALLALLTSPSNLRFSPSFSHGRRLSPLRQDSPLTAPKYDLPKTRIAHYRIIASRRCKHALPRADRSSMQLAPLAVLHQSGPSLGTRRHLGRVLLCTNLFRMFRILSISFRLRPTALHSTVIDNLIRSGKTCRIVIFQKRTCSAGLNSHVLHEDGSVHHLIHPYALYQNSSLANILYGDGSNRPRQRRPVHITVHPPHQLYQTPIHHHSSTMLDASDGNDPPRRSPNDIRGSKGIIPWCDSGLGSH